ncbi:MAG: histidine phosphatase family protein [Candidatus Rariloculaceae bacterium]
MRSVIEAGTTVWPRYMRAVLLCAGLIFAQGASAQDAELLALLSSGDHFGFMRHSTAPGSDDPPNFRIGDCATQRNLSSGGRQQAVEIGERLRANGISDARVVSSQWCRCVDTSELLGFGEIEELPSLNSLYSYPGQGRVMTGALAEWLAEQDLTTPTILVTHQVNISSLVRNGAGEGDILIVKRSPDGGFEVIDRLRPD